MRTFSLGVRSYWVRGAASSLKSRYRQLTVGTWRGSLKATLEGCSLSTIEHEEKIDNRWQYECRQKLSSWALLIDGRIIWHVGDAPDSNYKADSRENVRVPGKPESCARPKDEEPYGAEGQKHTMQQLKSSKQLSKHSLPRIINEV